MLVAQGDATNLLGIGWVGLDVIERWCSLRRSDAP
jgi:hypothetical protein